MERSSRPGPREASGPGPTPRALHSSQRSGWNREPCLGTLRPAAEDGVRQPGAAFGAPHQLQQLFGHFGHGGDWARRGSLLLRLRSRNIGMGRLEKRAAGRRRSDANGRQREARAGSALPARTEPVKPRQAAATSLPCRKPPDFRLPLAPPPQRAEGGESPPRKRKWRVPRER